MIRLGYFWRKGLWSFISLLFVLSIAFGGVYLYLESELPDVHSLNTVKMQVPLRIYTQDGQLIQEYGEKRRIPVPYEAIPKTLINALLATEDQRFFEHGGVDIFGLGRATLKLVTTGTKSQGGSTITMQVARNFFLSRKKTFLRKFNEILLAIKIDNELSKEKILELYLNRIYLGNRAYGVEAAAYTYYGKSLNQLTVGELAMLAGLPQAPSTQNPIINPKAAQKRRDHVLKRLLEEHYITNEAYDKAIEEPIAATYHGPEVQVNAPYVAEMIRQSLYDHFGKKAYTQGYNVYTTIHSSLQKTANRVIRDHLLGYDEHHGFRGPINNLKITNISKQQIAAALKQYPLIDTMQPALISNVVPQQAIAITQTGNAITLPFKTMAWARPALKKGYVGKTPSNATQILHVGDIIYIRKSNESYELAQVPEVEAALIALNPEDGAVEALVGGFNFSKSKFNRATQSYRQPGSSFKPFIYAAALEKGYTLATLVNDAPIVVEDSSQPTLWRPHNDNLTFNGPTRLREALAHSRNMVSIRVLDDLGFDYAIDFITRFGFEKKNLPKALSLALGSLSLTPMELTTAYAIFANGGYKIEPYLIDHITNNSGDILLKAKPAHSGVDAPRVLDAGTAFLMNSALQDVIQHGTARAATVLERHDIAGKTGTTNDQVDAWFAGFTPHLVTTVWMGYDNPQSLHGYGATLALPIWIDFMKVALHNQTEIPFSQPEDIVAVRIDPITGLLANADAPNAIVEYFRKDDIPTDAAPLVEPNVETNETTEQENLF